MVKVTLISKDFKKSEDGLITVVMAMVGSVAYDSWSGNKYKFTKDSLEKDTISWKYAKPTLGHRMDDTGVIMDAKFEDPKALGYVKLDNPTTLKMIDTEAFTGVSQECEVMESVETTSKDLLEAHKDRLWELDGQRTFDIKSFKGVGISFLWYPDTPACTKEEGCGIMSSLKKYVVDKIIPDLRSMTKTNIQTSNSSTVNSSGNGADGNVKSCTESGYTQDIRKNVLKWINNVKPSELTDAEVLKIYNAIRMTEMMKDMMKDNKDDGNSQLNKSNSNSDRASARELCEANAAQAGDTMTEDIKKYTDEIQSLKSENQTMKTESEAQRKKITELESAVKEKDTALVQAQAKLAQIETNEKNAIADELISMGNKKKKEELTAMSKDVLIMLRDERKEAIVSTKPVASKQATKPGFQISESVQDRIAESRTKLSNMYVGPGAKKQE